MPYPPFRMPFESNQTARRILQMAVLTAWLLLAGHPGPWASDTIHFKDGMRTVCEGSVREQDDELHCDYDGGLLIYPKADVTRIDRGRPAAGTQVDSKPPVTLDSVQSGSAPPALPADGPEAVPPKTARTAAGIAFYDPRRPRKYWSSETRQHDTLREALAALAEEFNRPVTWIEENLGESNDLGDIRERLASRLREPVAAGEEPVAFQGAAIEFYNPRRAHKYMTGADAPHAGFQEALAALAREFDKPVDWIERHMGTSNDVNQIRQNLNKAQASDTGR